VLYRLQGVYSLSQQLSFTLSKKVLRSHQPSPLPSHSQVEEWLQQSLIRPYTLAHIDLAIVDSKTSQTLNLQYRDIDRPTNVISLEYKQSRDDYGILYGELILCDDIIKQEAKEQNKLILAHYAHMIIHGALHLQGMDHNLEDEAAAMEGLEIQIMQRVGFANPYQMD
jgi:probable rRNA maturation factor